MEALNASDWGACTVHTASSQRIVHGTDMTPPENVGNEPHWDDISRHWAEVDAASFTSLLCTDIGATILRPVSDDEHAALLPALYDFESLVAMFRERALALLEPVGTAAPICARCIAGRAACVAAACLQLWVQENVTGPEQSDDAVAPLYPLPYANSILQREQRRGSEAVEAVRDSSVSRAARLNAERIRQWTSAAGEQDVGPEGGEDEEAPRSGAHTSLPQSLLHSTSLAALASSGEDAYEFSRYPHWLVTGRCLMEALVRPVGSTGAAGGCVPPPDEDDPFPVLSLEQRDPRLARLYEASDAVPIIQWWAGRAAVLHQRALVDQNTNDGLWGAAQARFSTTASILCPEYISAFGTDDVFHGWMVKAVLQETGVGREGGTAYGESDVDGFSSGAAVVHQQLPVITRTQQEREEVAMLLLEWGMAQHWFAHPDGAQTAFLLSKRESGLRTLLTGALGKRTKFQAHDTAQLVLRARSDGHQADIAVLQAAAADRLRRVPEANRQAAVQHAQNNRTDASEADAASDTASDLGSVSSGALASVGSRVLGGVAEVQLTDVDADTHVMEKMVLRRDGATQRTEEEQSARDKDFSSTGWGRSIALSSESAPAPTRSSSDACTDGPLSALDQCIVLALCLNIHNHSPADGLTAEEMRPYVERVLDTPLNWMVHSSGLLVRSRLEGEGQRTAERAALQLQALVDQHTTKLTPVQTSSRSIEDAAPAFARLALAHALPFPTRWSLRREAGDRYRALGAVRAALAQYEDLGLWDEVIECCILLDRPKRAERLVRTRLRLSPTPRLWCCLGLIQDDDDSYLTAWETSGHRYAKAQLALGKRHFKRGQLSEARECLQAGLSLSPHLDAEWFLLGVIGMRDGKMDEAVDAFSRVVQLDNTRADAWANLGGIYLRQQQWERGYAALEQATKADKRDFRMWSNYLVACIRTRNYARAMFVQRTLLDLYVQLGAGREAGTGGEGVDVPMLAALASAILASTAEPAREGGPEGRFLDASGNPARVHLEPLARLLDRVTQVITREPRVWDVYSRVQACRGMRAEALECRLRQCRALQTAGWERQDKAIEALAAAAGHVVEGYLTQGDPSSLTAARLFVQGLHARVLTGIAAASVGGEQADSEGGDKGGGTLRAIAAFQGMLASISAVHQ